VDSFELVPDELKLVPFKTKTNTSGAKARTCPRSKSRFIPSNSGRHRRPVILSITRPTLYNCKQVIRLKNKLTRHLFLLAATLLCGCTLPHSATTAAPQAASTVRGVVHGGQQPVSGATVQLYTVGTSADGSAATAMLTTTVTTSDGTGIGGNAGNGFNTYAPGYFNITGDYSCNTAPATPTSLVYLLISGGNPGLTSGTNNTAITLITALGQCQTLAGTFISVNEVTTVAAAAALAPYITSPTAIGSGTSDAAALAAAFTLAAEYVNTSTGASPGSGVPGGFSVPTQQINTLADILSGCVNTAGGATSGDGSNCGSLFLDTTSGSPPSNVLNAALNIVNNPSSNLTALLGLASAVAPFSPALSVPPPNWSVALTTTSPALTVAATSLSFTSTALDFSSSSQSVTLTNTGSSSITLSSIALTGANSGDYSISGDTCTGSLTGSGTCTLTLVFSPLATGARYADIAITNSSSATPIYVPLSGTGIANSITVGVSPSTITMADGTTQGFTATVGGDSSNSGVTWSIGSGVGALTSSTTTGVTYNAPGGLPGAGSVTLTATSIKDPTKTGTAAITLSAPSAPASQWVYYNSSGNLVYKTLSNTDNAGGDGYDQIMDFSTAGYEQGAVAIPVATVEANVSPSGDTTGATDTTAIQSAINTVSGMTLSGTTGLRGAVLLAAGDYYVDASLTITASGVVLRGSGSGTSSSTNTVIHAVSESTPYPLVILGNSNASPSTSGSTYTITDAYVPAGATTLDVASTSGLSVGKTILITRPITQAWINFMGMNSSTAPIDNCSGTCNWITANSSNEKTDRTITALSSTKITLDAPLSDSIDNTYITAKLQAYTFTSRISQVGVEDLREIAPVPATNLVPPLATNPSLVVTYGVLNAWIQNLTAQDTLQSIDIEAYSKQVTVYNVAITHTVTQTASAQFEEFYINTGATEILMDTLSDVADDTYFFATSSTTQGPNVLRNGSFTGNYGVEPHQRWATGLLVENTTISSSSGGQGGMVLINRGSFGTGQGWAIGWGVVWNSSGGTNIIQQPPGSMNWCIGCMGTQSTQIPPGGSTTAPQGDLDSQGTYVFPTSLYQAQLNQRLGLQ
jgi:hypothetical protein